MSAELLRRAAKVLREHAETAPRGPWKQYGGNTARPGRPYPQLVTNDAAIDVATCHEGPQFAPTVAPYVVLMHPPVALALAGLLTEVADHIDASAPLAESLGIEPHEVLNMSGPAIAVARAILREPS